jgi:hypothetical protein
MLNLMNLLSGKNGDEMFEILKHTLSYVGITVYNADGSYKDIYTLICEIAEVLNKEK